MPLAACQITTSGSDPESPQPATDPQATPAPAADPAPPSLINNDVRNASKGTMKLGTPAPTDNPDEPSLENPAGCCVGTAFYTCSEQATLDSCNETAACVQNCGTSDAACAAACIQAANPATAGCTAVPERDAECSGS